MAIEGIKQPEILEVDAGIRLKRYHGICKDALAWYQDEMVVWLVDGVRKPYTPEKLERMYTYLNNHGGLTNGTACSGNMKRTGKLRRNIWIFSGCG